ncbi:MAG: dTDP-3-amino-3,4,6-trideoxy-alpha-D-glucopyranose [Syntrophomonadaceae bacterium]|nr:dTDP-3-amino-3,4,6-trideoxy-alpha-D-glucopyranose [Bacillota bacterium]
MENVNIEGLRQEKITWSRDSTLEWYSIRAHFQAQSIIEIGRPPSLLDLACGDGTITSLLQKHFTRVVGVDASAKQIEKASQRCPAAEFHISLVEEFQTKEKFDTVIMIILLEHVIDPVQTCKAAANHLKPDGILIAQVPNALAVNRRIAKIMGSLKDEYELSPWDINVAGHRRSYDRNLLIKDIQSAGLKVISTGGVFYKMLSTPQMDWFLRNGLWEKGGFGWGRVGAEKKDWKFEFCKACYEYGKRRPDDCNIIYACAKKNISKELVEE